MSLGILVWWILIAQTCLVSHSASGDLDPNFGAGLDLNGVILAVAGQADGRVIVSGTYYKLEGSREIWIKRLTRDGVLDPDFKPNLSASGTVWSLLVQSDARILVAGEFASLAGKVRAGVVRLNSDGSLDESFNHGSGIFGGDLQAKALAVQPNGQILIGGSFTHFDGYRRNNLVRLHSDGSVDLDFDLVLASLDSVTSIVVQSDGGIAVVTYRGVRRLFPDGTPDPNFAVDASVQAAGSDMVEYQGKLYVCCGSVPGKNGPGEGIVRLLPNGQVDRTFVYRTRERPEILQMSSRRMIIDPRGCLLVGGVVNAWTPPAPTFQYVPVLRLHTDGMEDLTFKSDAINGQRWLSVSSLAWQPGGGIIVVGNFDPPEKRLVRLDGDTGELAPPVIVEQPGGQTITDGQVVTLAVWVRSAAPPSYQWQKDGQDLPGATNSVLTFARAGISDAGQFRVRISNSAGSVTSADASLNVHSAPVRPGSIDESFITAPGPNDDVVGIVPQQDGKILINGMFTRVDGLIRNQIARLNSDGSLDATFDPGSGPNPAVPAYWQQRVFVQSDGRILVQGSFKSFNGHPSPDLVRLQTDGRVDETLIRPRIPFTTYNDARMMALQQDGAMLIYGNYSLLRLNSNGMWDPCFDVRFDIMDHWLGAGVSFVLQRSDQRLVAVGEFEYSGVLGFNLDGTVAFMSEPGRGANAAALQSDDKLLLGWGGPTLARLNRDGSRDNTFNLQLKGFDNNSGYIRALAVEDSGKILVGGAFQTGPGEPHLSVARLHTDGRVDKDFAPVTVYPTNFAISTIALSSDGKVLVGGSFTEVDGFLRNRIVRLHGGEMSGPPQINIEPEDQFVSIGAAARFRVWASSASPLTYQWFHDGQPLPGATNQALLRMNSSSSDSGGYHVVISNEFGTTTSRSASFEVASAGPPIIVGQPQSQVVAEGGNALFSVTATNALPLSYQWQFNETNLRDATAPTLLLRRVPPTRTGNYRVLISNGEGFTVSAEATLTLKPPGARAGTLDKTFDPATFGSQTINSIAVQPGDGVIFGGVLSWRPHIVSRVFSDGYRDESFRPVMPFDCCALFYSHSTHSVVAQPDGRLLLAASRVYQRGTTFIDNYVVRLSSAGCLDPTFSSATWQAPSVIGFMAPMADPGFASLAVQMDGRILVAGTFTNFNGIARTNLARLYPDGTLDPQPLPVTLSGGEIKAVVVVPGGKILLGGGFTNVNGLLRNRVVLIDPEGNVDLNFDPGIGPNGTVTGLAVQSDGKVLLVGEFDQVQQQARMRIARLLSDGRLDENFSSDVSVSGANLPSGSRLHAVALDDSGQILVGGDFTAANGLPRGGLIRLYNDVQSSGPPRIYVQPASVERAETRDIALSSWVGGSGPSLFQWQRNGMNLPSGTNDVLELTDVQSRDSGEYRLIVRNFFGSVTSVVATVTVNSGRPPIILNSPRDQTVLAGENVTLSIVADSYTAPIYEWRFNGTTISNATGPELALRNVSPEAAGRYSVLVSNPAGSVATREAVLSVLPPVREPGAVDVEFDPGAGAAFLPSPITRTASVSAILPMPDGKIVIGGGFDEFGGVLQRHLARLHPDGTLDPEFKPMFDSSVGSLGLTADSKIVVAGSFYFVNGSYIRRLARLNGDGTTDYSFLGSDHDAITLIAVQSDGHIIAEAFKSLVRIQPNGWLDQVFTTSFEADNQSVAVQPDERIVLAYSRSNYGSQPPGILSRIERFLPNGQSDSSFISMTFTNRWFGPLVVSNDGGILVCSRLFLSGEESWFRLRSDGSFETAFHPAVGGWVSHIAQQPDGKIVLVGSLNTGGTEIQSRIARLHPEGHLDFMLPLDAGPNDVINTLALDTTGGIWIGGSFSKVGRFERRGIARLHGVDSSNLAISSFELTNVGFTIWARTFDGRSCFLEYQDSLDTSWIRLPSIVGDGTVKSFTDRNPSGTQRFYRLRAE